MYHEIAKEIKIERELAKIVLAALTGEKELKESSELLMEKYGIAVDPEPTLLEIARETQALAIGIETISEELRDQRLKAILKRIAMIVPSKNNEENDSLVDLDSPGE